MMSSSGAKPFDTNWAYLKTELRWLDRVLMMAVSRKRQDDKSLSRVANTAADKVTSHWWKGIITVNKGIDDREGPPPKPPSKSVNPVSYSQQLEARIQASYQANIALALPLLRDRLSLTEVEKNIVLMAIAPEINRRYGRLYDYLQEDEGALADLPTIDLCLRLLCRNDYGWQQARTRLTAPNSLASRGLLEWIGDEDGTLLSQQVRVSDDLANYLLADVPDAAVLEALLDTGTSDDSASVSRYRNDDPAQSSESSSTWPTADTMTSLPDAAPIQPSGDQTQQLSVGWDVLVLPKTRIHQLQFISRQACQRQAKPDLDGLIVLMAGPTGTGKTLAAAAIAAEMGVSLTCVDLETLSPEQYPRILTDSPAENPSLLLIKQGEQWFGRRPQVDHTWIHQWWQWRKQFGLTLVSIQALEAIRPNWRQKFDSIVRFPRPDIKARRQLWEQAFLPDIKTHKLDWNAIAQQLPLTGGEIQTLAQTIQLDLSSRDRSTVTLQVFRDALQLHHPALELKPSSSR